MNEKGMMPMDMHSLLTSLEAIEHICTHKKAKSESSEKAFHKDKRGKKHPGAESTTRIPKKLHFIAIYARGMGAQIPRTTLVIVVGLRKM
jgi:hypothetical protein